MEAQIIRLDWGCNLLIRSTSVIYMCVRVCSLGEHVCVYAHWVNIYEEAVVFLIWREPLHIVQQHRVSVEKVRMGDEDRRVWKIEMFKRRQQQIIHQIKTTYK